MNCQNCAKIFCSNRDKIDNCLNKITFLQADCKEIRKAEQTNQHLFSYSENRKCEYCVEYNGDGVEETDGFDYYSCELKNKQDLEKYGQYSSIENEIDENKCTYYLCEDCLFRKEKNNGE